METTTLFNLCGTFGALALLMFFVFIPLMFRSFGVVRPDDLPWWVLLIISCPFQFLTASVFFLIGGIISCFL